MIKRISLLVLSVCLFWLVLSPTLVHAQDDIVILDSSAQVQFPMRLVFSLSAQSDVNITDIRLRYTVEQESFAEVTSEAYVEFLSAMKVDVSWSLEMIKIGGLPPGAIVNYWWVITDAGGDRIETSPQQVQFDDNRYSWRDLTDDKITIYWYEGGLSFAQELMSAVQQALARLGESTGAYLERPVRLYIYASSEDLRGGLIFPTEWTGGQAFTRQGIIAIGIALDELDWGERAVTHELAHMVTHQMTYNPYSGLPTWLEEGLAMYAEGELEPAYASILSEAVDGESLITVRSLASPFSANPMEAYLAYAQSYSIVKFLIDNYGQDKMFDLLSTFEQGSGYDEALEKVYGFDMDGLNVLWRDYVGAAVPAAAGVGVHPALIGASAGIVLTTGFGVRRWRWRRSR
ncbi:MAG: peptidase MA domain-containing protein [Chloroflexi bacterium]|nr:peptidase MA domain-containing protein [Chloroflexota bacterium]